MRRRACSRECSFAIGIFNGGGYHAAERNLDKTIEGRLTLRPLPNVLPGLQVSFNGKYGKGNTAEEPDFIVHLGFISLESAVLVLTGQYYQGSGNQSGSVIDVDGDARDREGYSLFAEARLFQQRAGIFGRYDWFDPDTSSMAKDDETSRVIAGLAYHFPKRSKLVVTADVISFAEKGKDDDRRIACSWELNF